MSTLLLLSMFNDISIKILWIIDIIVLIIISIVATLSKRYATNDEGFRKNFKIGFYRCIGTLTALFLTLSAIITIIYCIMLIVDSKEDENKYSNLKCQRYTYISGQKVCAEYSK